MIDMLSLVSLVSSSSSLVLPSILLPLYHYHHSYHGILYDMFVFLADAGIPSRPGP